MRGHSQSPEGQTPFDVVREDPVAKRIVVECYSEMIRCLGDGERTMRTVIEKTLAKEE